MEDLLIYGAGALAVRGARRMFFGPSREARLADQVQHLSSQVAEQARMIQQLQAQALAPQPQQTGVSPAQQPVLDASRSGTHQLPDEMALASRGQGARRGKRLSSLTREVLRGAKRARHAVPVRAAFAGGDDSASSEDDAEPPSDSGPSERGLSPLPPGQDEVSTSGDRSSSEEESSSEGDPSQELPDSRSASSDSDSEESWTSDSDEEELPPVPQLPMPSSDEGTSEPQSSSEDGGLPAAPDNDSTSQEISSKSDGSISSQSDDSLPAQSHPAACETSTQSPGSQSGDPASSEPDDPEGSAISSSRDVSPSLSKTSGSDSEDYGSIQRSQDAASGSAAVGSPLQHSPPSSQVCPGMEASEEPADNSKDVSSALPGPSTASQPSRSMGDRHRQQCSGSEGGLSAHEASQADPEIASAPHETPCGTAMSKSSASMHSRDADKLLEKAPISFSHAAVEDEANYDEDADVAQDSQAVQNDGGSASQHAALGTKRGRGAIEEGPGLPQQKRCRSMFQRCSEALSGWLLGSTPRTACSAAAASAASVPDAQDAQEAHPETSTAEEVLPPPQAATSLGAQAESGDAPTCPADGGQGTPAAAFCGSEGLASGWAAEELATWPAVLEAQRAAEPIATGVFAEEEEWSTDAAFLTELESLFNNDERLRVNESSPPHSVQGGATSAESPALNEKGLQDLLDQEPHVHCSVAGTGEAAHPLEASQEPSDIQEAVSSPALSVHTPTSHGTGAAGLAGNDSGLATGSQPSSPQTHGAPEEPATGGAHRLAQAASSEGPSEGRAAEDAPGSEGQHDALYESAEGEAVSAAAFSPGRSGASLHASLRFYSAKDTFSPSPPVGDRSPRCLSPPLLSLEPLSPPRHDDGTPSTGCLSPRSPTYRHAGYSPHHPASSFGALAYQPEAFPRLRCSAERSPRPAYSSLPHSDWRRSLQGRSPSPCPRWHSPSPARRGRRSRDRTRSASNSQSPRRAPSHTPDSSNRRTSLTTPCDATPSHLIRRGRSRSATPYERSPTPERSDRRARQRRSSRRARSRSLSSQRRSPSHTAQEEELSPLSDGSPSRATLGRPADERPSPGLSGEPHSSTHVGRQYPFYRPTVRHMRKACPAHGQPWSPTTRPSCSPAPHREMNPRQMPSERYPTDLQELWYEGSPSGKDLSADSRPEVSPAQPQSPVDIWGQAEQSPGRTTESVSAELGLEQQARSPSPERAPAWPCSRKSSPPTSGQRTGDSSPSPATPAHSSGLSPLPTRGRHAAVRSNSPAASDSSSISPPFANGRHSADRSGSPAPARSPTPRTPPIGGNRTAEISSGTPDTAIERPRSPLIHRSPTPAPYPGPSADFWRNHQAAARTSSGSLLVNSHQPESPAFLFGAQPHDSQASEDDSACKERNIQPAHHAPSLSRASPTSPGATNSSPHDVPDVAHPKTVTPAARNQPAGRLASLSLGASRRQYTPGGSQEARRGSSTGVSMLPGPLPGRMRHLWPRAAQGPSSADHRAGESGEQSGEDADAMCGPAWERGVACSRRGGSSDSGLGLRPGQTWAERSRSTAAPQAQRSPEAERSRSSGSKRRSSSPAVCHGRQVSSHTTTSHGQSGSQRTRSSGGRRMSASRAVSPGQPISAHTTSHGHSGSQRSHRRKRCGPGRRALGAIMRVQRRFIGGWRHSRHRRGSRSRGRSSSVISAAFASAERGIDGAVQPAASQEPPPPPRTTDASPQLRAPPGRARGVLLPRSASHTPEAEALMWDPVVWEKSDAEWQRARALQEQHMQRMAASRELERAAAKAQDAAAEAQRTTACNLDAMLAEVAARRAATGQEMDVLKAALAVKVAAPCTHLGAQRAPNAQRVFPPNRLDTQMATARYEAGASPAICPAPSAVGLSGFPYFWGGCPSSRLARPPQDLSTPQTENLIDLTLSDSDSIPGFSE